MRRIQIIVNNGAGTGRAHRVWNETQCLLRGYKIKYEAHMTRYEGHAAKLAEQISRVKGEEPVYLLVVGGDGTINEVLNGITDFDKVRFGVIPTGSGNDFGRNLKLPKTPKESLREICACIRKDQRGEALYRIDLGQVMILITTDEESKLPVRNLKNLTKQLFGMADIYVLDWHDRALMNTYREAFLKNTPAYDYGMECSSLKIYCKPVDLTVPADNEMGMAYAKYLIDRYTRHGENRFINVLRQGICRASDRVAGDILSIADVRWLDGIDEAKRLSSRIKKLKQRVKGDSGGNETVDSLRDEISGLQNDIADWLVDAALRCGVKPFSTLTALLCKAVRAYLDKDEVLYSYSTDARDALGAPNALYNCVASFQRKLPLTADAPLAEVAVGVDADLKENLSAERKLFRIAEQMGWVYRVYQQKASLSIKKRIFQMGEYISGFPADFWVSYLGDPFAPSSPELTRYIEDFQTWVPADGASIGLECTSLHGIITLCVKNKVPRPGFAETLRAAFEAEGIKVLEAAELGADNT